MILLAGANLFHGTLIAGLANGFSNSRRKYQLNVILLSGGCFLNQILAEGLIKALSESGFKPLFTTTFTT